MKRVLEVLFPVFFASFALISFLLINRFSPGGRDLLNGALVFFAALAWGAMTWFRDEKRGIGKIAMVSLAIIGAVAAVEFSHMPPEFLSQYRIIYELIILGIILIQLYFIIERKKQD